MAKPLQALLLEDSRDDLDLLLLHLQRGGFKLTFECIETEKELRKALAKSRWDVIISDYSMPSFDGISALQIVRSSGYDTPFILISGAIGEELAVEAMRAGANDYFIKGNLQRLVPAIEREVKEARNRARHRKVEAHRRRLLKVVQQSLNEIYMIDTADYRFEYANETALTNLGYTIREIKHLTPADLLIEHTFDSFLKRVEPLIHKRTEKVVINTLFRRKNGTSYPVEMHIQMIRENHRSFFAAVVLDLTSHERNEQIIEKQRELAVQLEQGSRYKSEFLANMSHELRTPLNSIILLSKLLKENRLENLSENQVDYLNVIHDSGNNLMELINDVLDISKIEAGEMSFKLREVPILELCKHIEGTFRPIADQKGLNFSVQCAETEPKIMITDPLRIEQILKNLLSNAIKFTEKGSVSLTAEISRNGESDGKREQKEISFRVEDTGIGIPEDQLSQIFEAFRQVDGSDERRYGGTGLGLYISKEIASALGGEIAVCSTPGEGSLFSLQLPVDSRPSFADKGMDTTIHAPEMSDYTGNERAGQEGRPEREPGEIRQVLIVDDSEIHASALKELLETRTQICLIAETARETFTILQRFRVDLVILDLGLPDADGFEVIESIRKSYTSEELPLIVYSGRNLNSEDEDKYGDQVAAFVTKSSGSFQQLNSEIKKLFPEHGQRTSSTRQQHHHALEKKRILLVDDDKRNIYSLKKALESYGMCVITAENGVKALEILGADTHFDVVLMDMMMPEMNGYEATAKIRETPEWEHLPVIAVTASAMPADKKRCMEAGASDYLSKPINLDHLLSVIAIWAEKKYHKNSF